MYKFSAVSEKNRQISYRLLDKMAVLSDPDDEIIDIMIPVMVFAGTLAFLTYLKMRWIYQAL